MPIHSQAHWKTKTTLALRYITKKDFGGDKANNKWNKFVVFIRLYQKINKSNHIINYTKYWNRIKWILRCACFDVMIDQCDYSKRSVYTKFQFLSFCFASLRYCTLLVILFCCYTASLYPKRNQQETNSVQHSRINATHRLNGSKKTPQCETAKPNIQKTHTKHKTKKTKRRPA